ncbi:MAG: hypothetical protein ACETWM_21915, partial [Candidatus Lokiarchaeia archaeon]
MRTKKLIAITIMVTLLALILVPMASSAAASNQWIPILPQQDDNPSKAITTEPLGNYINPGDYLAYDFEFFTMASYPYPDFTIDYYMSTGFYFQYNDTRWGDWFIVEIGEGIYFAIDNTTREIGLNGTQLFWSMPANESVITRHTGVYSSVAIPTGVKAGDHIKIMALILIFEVPISVEQVTCEVLGRITTPTIEPEDIDFYDTWMLHGTWKNASFSVALQSNFETESGIAIASSTCGSYIDIPYLIGFNNMMTYDYDSSDGGPVPLSNTYVDDVYTAESDTLLYTPFTYDESGYWWMDMSAFNASYPTKVRLNSLEGSNVSFFLVENDPWGLVVEISQNVSIPDNWWEINEVDPGWNPFVYDNDTRTGYLDFIDYWADIDDLTRFEGYQVIMDASFDGPINSMFVAPPWIRDGAVMAVDTILPMFWPSPIGPMLSPYGDYPHFLLLPFRVTGAVAVSIGGDTYDCWKAELILPTDLSDVNLTQFQVELYYERTSGVLIKAKADIEGKMPIIYDGDSFSFGCHKTWTLADVSMIPLSIKALPTPEVMSSYFNVYGMVFGGNSLYTLDPSLYNGGSVTANASNEVYIEMVTTTRLEGTVSIDGKPIVKFMDVYSYDGATYDTAMVNFYYTPSELWAMGARESGFTVYAWNGTAWEPLNTTLDADGRVVSADAEHFSLFALVASPLTIWDILGPVG